MLLFNLPEHTHTHTHIHRLSSTKSSRGRNNLLLAEGYFERGTNKKRGKDGTHTTWLIWWLDPKTSARRSKSSNLTGCLQNLQIACATRGTWPPSFLKAAFHVEWESFPSSFYASWSKPQNPSHEPYCENLRYGHVTCGLEMLSFKPLRQVEFQGLK